MRIALYCRTARANETSLDLQEMRLRKYAVDRGDDIKSVIRETASGLSLKRPGLLSLFELAKSGEIDAVIAIDASPIRLRSGEASHLNQRPAPKWCNSGNRQCGRHSA